MHVAPTEFGWTVLDENNDPAVRYGGEFCPDNLTTKERAEEWLEITLAYERALAKVREDASIYPAPYAD